MFSTAIPLGKTGSMRVKISVQILSVVGSSGRSGNLRIDCGHLVSEIGAKIDDNLSVRISLQLSTYPYISYCLSHSVIYVLIPHLHIFSFSLSFNTLLKTQLSKLKVIGIQFPSDSVFLLLYIPFCNAES